jgi:hypothetical protein
LDNRSRLLIAGGDVGTFRGVAEKADLPAAVDGPGGRLAHIVEQGSIF